MNELAGYIGKEGYKLASAFRFVMRKHLQRSSTQGGTKCTLN